MRDEAARRRRRAGAEDAQVLRGSALVGSRADATQLTSSIATFSRPNPASSSSPRTRSGSASLRHRFGIGPHLA